MKNILTLVLAGTLLTAGCGDKTLNESEVPQSVKDAVKSKYPQVTITKWELEKDGDYSATFKSDSGEIESFFQKDGTFVKEEKE